MLLNQKLNKYFKPKNNGLLFLGFFLCFFQTEATTKIDSSYIDSVLRNSISLCYETPDVAIKNINFSLEKSKSISNAYLIAKSYNIKGIYFDITDQWDSALVYYNKALQISDSLKVLSIKGGAYNNIGLIYWNMDKTDTAMSFYTKSIVIFEKLGNQNGVASNLNNIGLILEGQKNFKEALVYHKKALIIREEIVDEYGIGASLTNLGNVYSSLNQNDSALTYFRKSLSIKRKIKDMRGEGFVLTNLGIIYFENFNKLDSAEIYLKEAVKIHKLIKNKKFIASSLNVLGRVYTYKKEYKKAENVLKEAESIASKENTPKELYATYEHLGKLYRNQKKYELSSSYYEKLYSLRKEMFNTEKNEQIIRIQKKYETEKKERENLELIHKMKVQGMELQTISMKNSLLIVSFFTFFLLTGLVLIYIKSKQKLKLKEQQINQEKEHISAVIEAEEKERMRIAKDLHDGLGQILSTAKINVACLEDNVIKEDIPLLNNSLSLIDEAVTEVRNISHDMMPNALIKYGLIAAIKELVSKINSTKRIKVDFQSDITHNLSKTVEVTLYRIVQEIINNMVKHAAATTINISLKQHEKQIILSIIDDGKGFDVNSINSSKGIGWKNINSRVAMLKGKIDLKSEINKGTSIEIKL